MEEEKQLTEVQSKIIDNIILNLLENYPDEILIEKFKLALRSLLSSRR